MNVSSPSGGGTLLDLEAVVDRLPVFDEKPASEAPQHSLGRAEDVLPVAFFQKRDIVFRHHPPIHYAWRLPFFFTATGQMNVPPPWH